MLEQRDTVIRAARTVDPGVAGLEAKKSWWWIKVHAIPLPGTWVEGRMARDESPPVPFEESQAKKDHWCKHTGQAWKLKGPPLRPG